MFLRYLPAPPSVPLYTFGVSGARAPDVRGVQVEGTRVVGSIR